MSNLPGQVQALRKEIAGIGQRRAVDPLEKVPLGHAEIDALLGGGLARGKMHEIFADSVDASTAAGLAAMMAVKLKGGVVWLRHQDAQKRGTLHAPGMAELGIDPSKLVLGALPDDAALLKATAEALRCTEIGAVVAEVWRMPKALDLTASRRLSLAAEASGITLLFLRVEAQAAPSATQTRWRVRSAASAPLEAGAPGLPSLQLELIRQRSGPSGGPWTLEWDRDAQRLGDQIIRREDRQASAPGPSLSRPVLSVPGDGQAQSWRHSA